MNHILKITLMAMAVVLSVISAYLTAVFLFNLGDNVGLGVPFAVAGVALDIIKTLSPVAVVVAWNAGSNNTAISGGILAICLTGLSIMASFNSINDSVSESALASSSAKQESSLFQTKVDQISLQIKSTLDQQNVYTRAGMATKAAELNQRLDQLNQQLEKALSGLRAIKTGIAPAINKIGTGIVAGAIELSCIVTLMLVGSMTISGTENVGHTRVQATSQELSHEFMHTVSRTVSHQEQTVSQVTGNSQTFEAVKQQIISGSIKPSERGISEATGVTRYKAAVYLAAMEEDGTLGWEGRNRIVIHN